MESTMNLIDLGYSLDLRPVGDDTDKFIQELMADALKVGGDITVWEYPSGDIYNGWVIPSSWKVNWAIIYSRGCSWAPIWARNHPLSVWGYSESFVGELEFCELEKHIFTCADLPEAVPYHWKRYYSPEACSWGFSLPYEVYQTLFKERESDYYSVSLETEFTPGSLKVLEWTLPGKLDDTIILNAHCCHPKQANDDLSGCQVVWDTMKFLAEKPRRYTYKALICPELLGPIFWLREQWSSYLKAAILLKAVGNNALLRVQSSFCGNSDIDRMASTMNLVTKPFRTLYGNDEIALEAPGYEIPTTTFTRYPFHGYHTSIDTPEFINPKRIKETQSCLQELLENIERNRLVTSGCLGVHRLSHLGLYREPEDDEHGLMSGLQRDSVGGMDILSLAEKYRLGFRHVADYVEEAARHDIVHLGR